MEVIKACGVVLTRSQPRRSVLLMRHANRWDFPKGHLDAGENEVDCALRELYEETGIGAEQVAIDDQFRYVLTYPVYLKRFNFEAQTKIVVMFLGHLLAEVEIRPTEHIGYQWLDWHPPHSIQGQTIDPTLRAVEQYWADHPERAWGSWLSV